MTQSTRPIRPAPALHYSVPRSHHGWELSEETMPESVAHDVTVDLLRALLMAWVAREGRRALVARNLAVRWDEERPAVGVDPDVSILEPPPPGGEDLRSVRTWLEDHEPPLLAIEVVSETNPHKDYVIAPDKYAASGTGELVLFDPLFCGPATGGGPYRLQLWSRDGAGTLCRVHAGDGPVFSPTLNVWFVVVHEGRRLRIADDAAGERLWLTAEERERAAKERLAVEKDAALARIAELEAELARRR